MGCTFTKPAKRRQFCRRFGGQCRLACMHRAVVESVSCSVRAILTGKHGAASRPPADVTGSAPAGQSVGDTGSREVGGQPAEGLAPPVAQLFAAAAAPSGVSTALGAPHFAAVPSALPAPAASTVAARGDQQSGGTLLLAALQASLGQSSAASATQAAPPAFPGRVSSNLSPGSSSSGPANSRPKLLTPAQLDKAPDVPVSSASLPVRAAAVPATLGAAAPAALAAPATPAAHVAPLRLVPAQAIRLRPASAAELGAFAHLVC